MFPKLLPLKTSSHKNCGYNSRCGRRSTEKNLNLWTKRIHEKINFFIGYLFSIHATKNDLWSRALTVSIWISIQKKVEINIHFPQLKKSTQLHVEILKGFWIIFVAWLTMNHYFYSTTLSIT